MKLRMASVMSVMVKAVGLMSRQCIIVVPETAITTTDLQF